MIRSPLDHVLKQTCASETLSPHHVDYILLHGVIYRRACNP